MEGNLGEDHSGELHRETAVQKANRIIGEEMSRLGWQETELACRLKNDPGKLAVAARVRKETTLPVKWIAERLQMGTSKSLKPMLLRWTQACGKSANQSPPTKAPCQQLQFQPPVDPFKLSAGGDSEHGAGGAASGQQPADDLPALPRAGAGGGCGEVVCGDAGQCRGGESGPGERVGGQDCGAAEGGLVGVNVRPGQWGAESWPPSLGPEGGEYPVEST